MPSTPIWKGTTALFKTPDSDAVVVADRVTLTDVYQAPFATCISGLLARGTFGTGLRAGWVVTSSKVDPGRGGAGKLTIAWEMGGADGLLAYLPVSEFDCQPVELYPKVERNAAFAGIEPTTVSLCYQAIHGQDDYHRGLALDQLAGLSDPTQFSLGADLYAVLSLGTESYYLAGLRYVAVNYSYSIPSLSMGGFLQDPSGPIASSLPNRGIGAWLRLADAIQPAGVNGSMYKKTSSWLGGPNGHWQTVLYS